MLTKFSGVIQILWIHADGCPHVVDLERARTLANLVRAEQAGAVVARGWAFQGENRRIAALGKDGIGNFLPYSWPWPLRPGQQW